MPREVVAVVGDALLDVIVAPLEPSRPGADVPASVTAAPGGQGANVAVRLAMRGAKPRLACGLADDPAGRVLRGSLEAEGVQVEAVSVAATGSVAVLLDPHGERTMFSQRAPFVAGVDVERLAAGAAWLVISGYGLAEPGGGAFAARCGGLPARRAILGCTLTSAALPAWSLTAAAVRADLLILNEDEARALLTPGDQRRDPAAVLAGRLATVVVVTSPHQAVAAGPGLDITAVSPSPSAPAVDATGAGDAFAAAVIGELGAAWPPSAAALHRAMCHGLELAGQVVSVRGAQSRVAAPDVGRP